MISFSLKNISSSLVTFKCKVLGSVIYMKSKQKGNYQALIQSTPTSLPRNPNRKKSTHILINVHETLSKPSILKILWQYSSLPSLFYLLFFFYFTICIFFSLIFSNYIFYV